MSIADPVPRADLDNRPDDPGIPPGSVALRRARVVQGLAMVAAVLPIFVAAIRNGIQGWYPTLDAAMTVLRTRQVVTAHPPLVGMWASVSSSTGVPTFFPGAIQLYLLAIPVHLLGNSWGTLLGMAALNATWVLLAAWLVGRRLGPQLATVACLAFAALVWTMGSELVVDISPMQMVTIPFAAFLIAVWAVADGDLKAIPVLAFLANYLLLSHLVLTFLIPAIGVGAPLGLALHLRRRYREDPDSWAGLRRRLIRMLGLSAVITVVCWLPPLYQQVTGSPGNLSTLWHASRSGLDTSLGYGSAIQVVVSILAVPPFWFRDSFTTPTLSSSPTVDGLRMTLGVAVLVLFGLFAFLAHRRRDRTVLTLLAVASVAIVASIVNITMAPTVYGFKRQHFRSLWSMAMVVWFALVVAAIRTVVNVDRSRWRPRVAAGFATATVLLALVALPHKDPGPGTNGTTPQASALARKTLGPSVAALRGRGTVLVVPPAPFSWLSVTTALILELDTVGVDVCVPEEWALQFGARFACGHRSPAVLVFTDSMMQPIDPGTRIIAQASVLSAPEQRELARGTAAVTAWLTTQPTLRLTPRVRADFASRIGDERADHFFDRSFDAPEGRREALAADPRFAEFIVDNAEVARNGSVSAPIETGPISDADLVRWARLVHRSDDEGYSIRITERTTRHG